MSDINSIIQDKLNEIERTENVRILHCVESGSRAWGFASPDSDYDVRFIYIRNKEHYLKLEQTRDVIEWQLDDTLDINGWDLQKTLRLLHKSNPTVFEWNNSPIVYRTTDIWQSMSGIINNCFDSKSGMYHYISTAASNSRAYLRGDTVKLKKYFYAVRPILAAKWIAEKGTPPPMLFSELVAAELEDDIKPIIEMLLELKVNSPETTHGERIEELNDYINISLEKLNSIAEGLPSSEKADWKLLDEAFLYALEN
ncbi:MAG: nucleotidyltransferase domain-containing protein [Oscillospiraceae bacterium]|nr:nucleotidyltransferase domain-containing protein [Oscillospiraceae bacterium]